MAVLNFVRSTNCYIMLYPKLVVKQGKTFTSLSGEAFSVSASHNYCGIEGRFKAVKISYCPDVSKYGRNLAAGQEERNMSIKGKIVGKPRCLEHNCYRLSLSLLQSDVQIYLQLV